MSRLRISLQSKAVIIGAILLSALTVTFSFSGCNKDDKGGGVVSPAADNCPIFIGNLAEGFDLGVNTSHNLTDWVTVDSGVIKMSYPAGQSWGAVFITEGEPTNPPRPSRDLSGFSKLVFEICGAQGGESVWIGVKDNTDPDNGTEDKVRISGMGTDWEKHEIRLTEFSTADLKRIYVPIEFVFDGGAKTVRARNIEYRR